MREHASDGRRRGIFFFVASTLDLHGHGMLLKCYVGPLGDDDGVAVDDAADGDDASSSSSSSSSGS